MRTPVVPSPPGRGPSPVARLVARCLLAARLPSLGLALLAPLVLLAPRTAPAQYFGRNKVTYEKFDFRIFRAPHFDVYFYPPESLAVFDAARMAERWDARHAATFNFQPGRRQLIIYADQPDFQQTNVIPGDLTEETGGVTEALRSRVVLPLTGVYADNDHVIGHELVHVWQYGVAQSPEGGGLQRMNALPLWLVEGMAEYLSLGRADPNTAMWMRDAARRNKLPTIKQLTRDTRFFPYRYGQAVWAFVGGRWGDRAVADVYRAALRYGWDEALRRVLGVSSDSLSKLWIAATREAYTPLIAGRTAPDQAGDRVLVQKEEGAMNVSPAISPDGRYVAFFSRRGLFSIDLFVADARTGKIVKQLTSPTNTPHFDALSFIYNAGTWSPDGRRFAFVVYAGGDNQLAVLDVRSGRIVRRYKVGPVGAIAGPAWSPDGRRIAFSGSAGGVSDLYVLDVESGAVEALTSDRYADLQPTWSPDGATIAFATDRGPGTSFDLLTYAPLHLALLEVGTGAVRLVTPFPGARHLNPQFSPDGRDLFFVSDQDGFPDVYRASLATGAVARVTRVATGVSGITHLSPAMSVAQRTGRMLFSVFERSGYNVYGLDSARTAGEPVTAALPGEVAAAGLLPPAHPTVPSLVTAYLHDPLTGLPPATQTFATSRYRPRISLLTLGQPSLGVVGGGGQFGTAVFGAVSGLFSDPLNYHTIAAGIQASGQVQDVGGELFYQYSRRRWNLTADVAHVPYLTGFTAVGDTTVTAGADTLPATLVQQFIRRVYVDQITVGAQYPFSTTRRFEVNAGYVREGFSTQVQSLLDVGGELFDQGRRGLPSPSALTYGQVGVALVGDNSYFAFTSPVLGWRYRFEVAPTFGSFDFYSVTADYRRYFQPARELTVALRGLHYGRYGRDAESNLLSPLYIGGAYLVRGYDVNSFDPNECAFVQDGSGQCPELNRLVGSRIAVANGELRVPLFGTREFGLFNVPFLPTELAPFVDAGVAWTSRQAPRWHLSSTDPGRIPVFSAGVSARVNLFGFLVGELFYAHPFQRPGRSWVWGGQLAPGW
jgi:Tol biopolymer transport system component